MKDAWDHTTPDVMDQFGNFQRGIPWFGCIGRTVLGGRGIARGVDDVCHSYFYLHGV